MRFYPILVLIVLLLAVGLCGCATQAVRNLASEDKNGHYGDTVENPGYFLLLPLSVPFDIVTSPIQGIGWLMYHKVDSGNH